MKTLKERIEECKAKAAKIIADDPEITEVCFRLENCDIDEIKKFDATPKVGADKLRGLVTCVEDGTTIWAFTKPFKSVKPIEYEFD